MASQLFDDSQEEEEERVKLEEEISFVVFVLNWHFD